MHFELFYISPVIPTVFGDIQDRMDTWGKQGVMDPSKNVYDVLHLPVVPFMLYPNSVVF